METLKKIGKVILEKYSTRFFTLDELAEASGAERFLVRRAMERFCREALIKKIWKAQRGMRNERGRPELRITYRLTDKQALAARIAPRLKEDSAAERMWKVIRLKKVFTRRDLVVLAGASRENAKWYTKQLRLAGIIKASRAGGRDVEWMMVKDVGAKRPGMNSRQ